MKLTINQLIIALLIFGLFSCSKNWLDIKSDKQLVVPVTLDDMEQLLNNYLELNTSGPQSAEVLMEQGTDNYFFTASDWTNVQSNDNAISAKNAYRFGSDIFEGKTSREWNIGYRRILYANTALMGLREADSSDINRYRVIMGRALFIRANALHALTETFAMPYDPQKSSTMLAIPLKTTNKLDEITKRATQDEVYNSLIKDLTTAAALLPETDITKIRPTKPAAFALLARIYLNMGKYDSALYYAEKCLELNSLLMDYNTLPASANPFPQFNDEVIYHCASVANVVTTGKVDTMLYEQYHVDDLRRSLFFANVSGTAYKSFKGNYSGSRVIFSGLATDEIYLIKSECLARSGHHTEAMDLLNTLLKTRWNNQVQYVDLVAVDAEQALSIILTERRKELLFRGLRWQDLRRLNREDANITVTHGTVEENYVLLPNSNKYAYPIPPDVIAHSGISQNNR